MANLNGIDMDTFNEDSAVRKWTTNAWSKGKKGGWISDSTWKKVVQTNEKKRNIWSAKSMRQKYKLQVEYRAIDKKEVPPPPKKMLKMQKKPHLSKLCRPYTEQQKH